MKIKNPSLNRQRAKKGFTIIEVTLVTAFIAFLLIAIATILVNISAIYQKGATLKTVNEVGRNLVTEFTTALNSAPSIDSISICNSLVDAGAAREACLRDGARKFIFQDIEAEREDPITHDRGMTQDGGVFCTGEYSYIWNTYYGRNESNPIKVIYNGGNVQEVSASVENDHNKKPFKLVRFQDKTYRACSANVDKSYQDHLSDTHTIDIRQLANGVTNPVTSYEQGFLSTSEIDLDLYEFVIFPIAQDSVTLRALISGTFILATERGDVGVLRSGDYCDVTNNDSKGDGSGNLQDLGSNFNYCGINKFNFAARTAGSSV